MSTRNRTRKLLEEFKQELSSRERESSSRRRPQQREVPGGRPGPFSWKTLGGFGIAAGLVLAAPVTLAAGAAAAAAGATGAIAGGAIGNAVFGGAGVDSGGEESIMVRLNSQKIDEAIDEDKLACLELNSSLHRLEKCVADFAVFCRDYIDSVLSSDLVEDEFSFLLSILRGTHSPANTRVPLSTLIVEEVYIHATRVRTLMEQLQHSATNQEAVSITEQILNELREGPNDEIRSMIQNVIEAKFTEACKS